MAISIVSRPGKELDNGYFSKWNGSATPLQYKLSSTKFPTNSEDTLYQTDSAIYDASKKGVIIESNDIGLDLLEGDYVQITSSNPQINDTVYGVYKVKEVVSGTDNEIVIDLYISQSYTDEFYVQRYYKGYKGLVKVFVGAPEYHPYNTDNSKPQREIGVIEVEFDSNNEGVCNVRSFVKPDLSTAFDYEDINSHNAWTGFAIEYAESWDGKNSIDYEEDILDNCVPFVGFTNPDFTSGLGGWAQTVYPGESNNEWNVLAGGKIYAETTTNQQYSNILYQDINTVEGVQYTANITGQLITGNIGNSFRITLVDDNNNVLGSYSITNNSSDSYTLNFVPFRDSTRINFYISSSSQTPDNWRYELDYYQISSDVTNQCKYSSFAILGTKQFQDSLGGNFGDKIANRLTVGDQLTHFDSLTYPFYINAIIPATTFYMSENGESVFLEMFLYDSLGNNIGYYKEQIVNQSDGVYVIEPTINESCSEWSTGTAQIISVPGNLLQDGDNGTYDDQTPANWDISVLPYSVGSPEQIGAGLNSFEIGDVTFGDFGYGSPSMVTSIDYKSHQFDTSITTQVGQTYIIESEVIYNMNGFEPTQRGNANVYLYADGIPLEDQDIKMVKNIPPISGDTSENTFTNLSTTFVATSSTVNIRMGIKVDVDINISTGGAFALNNTTVKGPIEFLTTKKNIESSCGCTYNLHMRWLNDLGGWEQWNFTQYRTENEVVTERLEIKRDITENWDDTFINGDTQYDTIKVESRKEIVVRSGSLRKDQLKAVNQIRRSIKVQALINDKWVTVSLNTGSYLILDENDKTQEITFSIKLPDTLIQEQ